MPQRPNPELEIKAHQYLYYVLSTHVWSDRDYDRWCDANDLQGGGGSDCADHYSTEVKELAEHILAFPKLYPPTK